MNNIGVWNTVFLTLGKQDWRVTKWNKAGSHGVLPERKPWSVLEKGSFIRYRDSHTQNMCVCPALEFSTSILLLLIYSASDRLAQHYQEPRKGSYLRRTSEETHNCTAPQSSQIIALLVCNCIHHRETIPRPWPAQSHYIKICCAFLSLHLLNYTRARAGYNHENHTAGLYVTR
jgi:hypothetical protein